MTDGSMYPEAGSWNPNGKVKGGPPVIPGSPTLMVPNVLPRLEGIVVDAGGLAPEAVEEFVEASVNGFGMVGAPRV